MRGLIAMILALPIYYDLLLNHNWGAYVCAMALQLLAGCDSRLKDL